VCFIGAAGLGVYVGARAIQDYVNRDSLPAADEEVPTIQSSTVLITSTGTPLALQGTLSFDTSSGSYEFTGLAGSPNATDRVSSPDGETVYILNPNATWTIASGDEEIVASVEAAVDLLSDNTTADAILTDRIRRGYVELLDETEEGLEPAQLTRYDIALDLDGFAESFPLQWDEFRTDAIPGATEESPHEISMWLDDDAVLVRVRDEQSGWSWERLMYSDGEFVAFRPPPMQVIDPVTQEAATGIDCTLDALDISWTTTLPSCDESEAVGRQLASSVGLATGVDTPAAELAFASVCSTLQGDDVKTFDDPAYLELAGLLVDTGVCPGDTSMLEPAGDDG
jgi:hypothetical protein